MSYDLYCYHSYLGNPDPEEAQAIIDEMEEDATYSDFDINLQQRILEALMQVNPRLMLFDFDYDKIAASLQMSEEEARLKFSYLEIDTPEEDLATQITISRNKVSISIPYWYRGAQAKEVFEQVQAYTLAIAHTAGYFVYDPQIDCAYDPIKERFRGLAVYESVIPKPPDQEAVADAPLVKGKPWWKFW